MSIKILCEIEVEANDNQNAVLAIEQMMSDYYKHYFDSKIINLEIKGDCK